MATPEVHALLSASSAARWLNCPGSVFLAKGMEDNTSIHAEAGRLAHAIAELKLQKKFVSGIGPKKFTQEMDKLTQNELYEKEMANTTDTYVDYVEEQYLKYKQKPYLAIEQKVDFSLFVPEGFGTADCIIIGNGEMDVIDFKNGKGVAVDAEENPQMKLYALGAIHHYLAFYNVETIRLHIVQPRVADGIQCWQTTKNALIDWGVGVVKPKALDAFNGKEEYAAGDWCRFCKAKAVCRSRADRYTALEDFTDKPTNVLNYSEIGELLQRAEGLKKWATDLEEYALNESLQGKEIPGWKVVAGRSVRAFDDTDTAFEELQKAGIEEAMLYKRTPLTLAQIEKEIGKKQFSELVGNHIVIPQGKPTLVPISDKRAPYNSAEEDFKN